MELKRKIWEIIVILVTQVAAFSIPVSLSPFDDTVIQIEEFQYIETSFWEKLYDPQFDTSYSFTLWIFDTICDSENMFFSIQREEDMSDSESSSDNDPNDESSSDDSSKIVSSFNLLANFANPNQIEVKARYIKDQIQEEFSSFFTIEGAGCGQ